MALQAVPKGIMTDSEAALVMQVMGLSRGNTIPSTLMVSIVDGVADFIEG